MANTANPPDGMTIITGTWGTDIQRNDSIPMFGGSVIELMATSTATKFVGPWLPVNYYYGRYNASVWLQRPTAGARNITVKLNVYRSDRTTLNSSTVLWSGDFPGTGIWYRAGASYATSPGAGPGITTADTWMQISVEKGTEVLSTYVGMLELTEQPPSWYMDQASATTAVPANSWQQIAFDNAIVLPSLNINLAQQNNGAVVFNPGRYVITAKAQLASLSAGTTVKMRISTAYPTASVVDAGIVKIVNAGTQSFELTSIVNVTTTNLTAGGVPVQQQLIYVEIWHNDGAGARNLLGGTSPSGTSFAGVMVAR